MLVALVDNPSHINNNTNEDWLIIRNAHNSEISLTELHLLNQFEETDTFTYSRLEDRSDVNDVRVFLSTGILDHAPFIIPSSDSNNPQSDGVRYVGGDTDVGSGNDFHLTDFTKLGESAGSNRVPSGLLYLDVDGSFNIQTNINDVFVQNFR